MLDEEWRHSMPSYYDQRAPEYDDTFDPDGYPIALDAGSCSPRSTPAPQPLITPTGRKRATTFDRPAPAHV
jgi:hypothetical protein